MELQRTATLLVAPEPLSPAARRTLIAAWFLVAVTRVLWVARSPWDWDEMLFSMAIRDYDVSLYHPHPPGFPLFVGVAAIFHRFGLPEFRALQAVTLIASVALFPTMVAFCRELRLSLRTSFAASLLLSFLPNVWFFGETAFSDVPSLVLSLGACTLLLRGCRSGRAYVAGAIILAVAAGFRPQNLIIGAAAALIATSCQVRVRRLGLVIASGLAGAAIITAAYGAAIYATGWERYWSIVEVHERYIRTVDSFLSATRPSLLQVADDFFFWPFRAWPINTAIAILCAVSAIDSIVRRRTPILIAIATFGPFAIFAWLMLDWLSASRFSIAYAPLFAVLAADGISVVAAAIAPVRLQAAVTSLGVGALILACALWTLPAVRLASRDLSPPVQAIQWIRNNLDPATTTIYVGSLGPHSDALLSDYRRETFAFRQGIVAPPRSWTLKEGTAPIAGTRTFRWPRDPLWNIARRRYFEVSVVPIR